MSFSHYLFGILVALVIALFAKGYITDTMALGAANLHLGIVTPAQEPANGR